ncbi:MAG: Gfo/Idh/MocA family oxidoreductase [Lachnospiraceae bacterium]
MINKPLKAAILKCPDGFLSAMKMLSGVCRIWSPRFWRWTEDPEKAKAFAEKFGCRWSTDFDDILDAGVDVVHLCLPHGLHPVMAIKAMKAGIQH